MTYARWTLTGSTLRHRGGLTLILPQIERMSEAMDAAHHEGLDLLDAIHMVRCIEDWRERNVGLAGVADAHFAAVRKELERDES
jgi:uncharacterized damage-inducible protein DinB